MKMLLLTVAAALALAGTARAQEPKSHDHEHAQPPAVAGQKADQKTPMMGMAGMKASMEAKQKKLDDLVAQLNAATGNDRIEKLIAVVNELVAEQKGMHEHMSGMMKEAK
jgi:hypothetical protein